MSDLKLAVENIVRSVAILKTPDINSTKTLKELGVDSLELMNIFLVIAEKYAVDIPDEEIDQLDTIDKIVDYLTPRLGKS